MGSLLLVVIGNSPTAPVVVMRPMLLLLVSVNHNALSGPDVIQPSALLLKLLAVGMGKLVMVPDVVIRPTALKMGSMNHSAPSEPAAIPLGMVGGVVVNSVMVGPAATAVDAPRPAATSAATIVAASTHLLAELICASRRRAA